MPASPLALPLLGLNGSAATGRLKTSQCRLRLAPGVVVAGQGGGDGQWRLRRGQWWWRHGHGEGEAEGGRGAAPLLGATPTGGRGGAPRCRGDAGGEGGARGAPGCLPLLLLLAAGTWPLPRLLLLPLLTPGTVVAAASAVGTRAAGAVAQAHDCPQREGEGAWHGPGTPWDSKHANEEASGGMSEGAMRRLPLVEAE